MIERNWKIIYSEYAGAQKRAVDFIYRELGNYFLRDNGVYSFHSMACERNFDIQNCNCVVIGTYENPLFQKYIKNNELPKDGYVVKVIDNPFNVNFKLVLLCGYTNREVFYAAVDFVDDYFSYATPSFDAYIRLKNELFLHKLPDYYISTSPSFKTRSVFTWGHPINDYRQYFENLARLKLNQVIIWNDYLPLNSDEIVEYAHSYGIEVIWGFSWGWGFNCKETNINDINALKNKIIEEYNRTYKNASGDGIYFQSFTEMADNNIDGISVSSAVTELVNSTAGELLSQNPNLHIQFGLHATSVRDSLFDISQIDDRIEIIWEDCGGFPYKATPKGINSVKLPEEYEKQYDFADRIIDLRNNGESGLVYKCMLTMDWSRNRVTHQQGAYVLGETGNKIKASDEALINDIWRFFSAEWIENGKYAYNLTRHLKEKTGGNMNMCMAGMFSGGIWFPTALCSQMFWNCDDDYSQIRKKILLRHWIRF